MLQCFVEYGKMTTETARDSGTKGIEGPRISAVLVETEVQAELHRRHVDEPIVETQVSHKDLRSAEWVCLIWL